MSFFSGHIFKFNFRAKVVLLSLGVIVFPLLFYSYYSYDFLKKTTLNESKESLISESQVLKDYAFENFQWVTSESLVPLFSKREAHEELLYIIQSGIDNAKKLQNDDMTDSVINYFLEGSNQNQMNVFICKKNHPSEGYYYRQSDRNLINTVNQAGKKFFEILHNLSIKKGDYHHYYFWNDSNHYLVSFNKLDDEYVIVIFHDISRIRNTYEEVEIKKSFAFDLADTVSSINRIEPSYNNIVVIDANRNRILGQRFDPSSVTDEMILECSDKGFWEGYTDKKNNLYSYMFFFRQAGWFFLYTINLNHAVEYLNDSMMIIWFISVLVVIFSILLSSLILRKPLHSLSMISKTIKVIQNADLTDKKEVEKIKGMLPECSKDEFGLFSETIKEMTESVSNNTIELISASSKKNKLEGELKAATQIQQGILPISLKFSNFDALNIAASLVPAKEVGGDLYDVCPLDDDKIAFVIGDVSDKGVPSALFMAMTVTLIRECISLKMPLEKLISEVNKRLCQHNPNMMFVTLFLGVFNKNTHNLQYINCGHCLPLMVVTRAEPEISSIEGISGPPLGAVSDYQYKEFKATLPDECTVYFYTDGVSEALNTDMELYGEERIKEFLKKFSDRTPSELCSLMLNELSEYRKEASQSDDITMLAVRL